MSRTSPKQPDTKPRRSLLAERSAESPLINEWSWTARRYRAAADVADGTLKPGQIAKRAGISARQLSTWKKQTDFASLVQGILGNVVKAFPGEVVVTKAGRLRVLIDLHNKLLAIIEARALQYADERDWAAGESTGLIVTKETQGRTRSKEAAVDTGTIKMILEVHEQIAKELGQWEASVSVRHTGRVDHVHRSVVHSNLTVDELEALEAIALQVQSREHEAAN